MNARIGKVEPIGIDVVAWRAVPERVNGTNVLNSVDTVFNFHPGVKAANGRYSAPGESAIYTSIGKKENAWHTVFEEFGTDASQPLILASKQFKFDRVLDLTDPESRSLLGVSLADLRESAEVAKFETTHILGSVARKNKFQAIKAPSAPDQNGTNIVILGE